MYFFSKNPVGMFDERAWHDYAYKAGLTLCFDLDGTLVDTAPDLIRVLNLVLAEEGLPETDYNTIRKLIGFGSRRMIITALTLENHAIDNQRLDSLQRLFLKLYADDIAQLSQPFAGVIETLRHWRAHGVSMAVCTNKPGYLARPLLKALNIDHFFDRIIGGDEAPRAKPDPRHIWTAASHRDAGRIIMVGDAYPDIRAAHNARIGSIAMRYGYTPIPILRLKADKVLSDFRQIPQVISQFNR